jgi:hypothetical protein
MNGVPNVGGQNMQPGLQTFLDQSQQLHSSQQMNTTLQLSLSSTIQISTLQTVHNKTNENKIPEMSNSEENWKMVSTKKKKRNSHDNSRNVKQKTINDYWQNSPSTSNRFQNLPEEDDETENTDPKEIKPPIFIHGVNNIKPLTDLLETIAKDSYVIKLIGGAQAKIQLKTTKKYNAVITESKKKNTEFHSYQHKLNRTFKIVIKNLHHSTDKEELLEEIRTQGHEVIRVTNILHRVTKAPLPMFIVELKQNPNNKHIYKIEFLMRTKIIIEPPHQKREIMQCKNCQRYGHAKQYCYRRLRCVKCTGDHHTSQCNKQGKRSDVKCVNCLGNHPANYKGCTIYKEIKKLRFPTLRPKQYQETDMATNIQPPLVQQERSYAQIARENTQQIQQNQKTIQQTQAEILLAQAIAKMEQIMTVFMESINNTTKMIKALVTKIA